MRIGIDYTAAIRQRAGIGRYTRGLVGALTEIDRRNEYVLFAAGHAASGIQHPGSFFPPHFRLRSLPISDRWLAVLWHRLRLPLWVDLVTGPVDIFHAPDFVLPPLRRGKSLVTVHDLSFIRYPEGAEASLQAYLKGVVPRSVRRADLVLADSQSTKDDIVELFGASPAKVEVVYPGVEAHFRPLTDETVLAGVERRYRLCRPFILSLGRLEPRKNFVRLIEAYAMLKERPGVRERGLRLAIAGERGWLYEGIFQRVDELGLQGEVVFLGFVADEDLPALYSSAELFVFPSLYEGFGLPVLEAMACGTPVVTSNRSSLPEVVGDAGLMVEATDVEGLAQAMGRALGDEALRERMVAKGLERARKFSWGKAAQKLLRLYEGVAG